MGWPKATLSAKPTSSQASLVSPRNPRSSRSTLYLGSFMLSHNFAIESR